MHPFFHSFKRAYWCSMRLSRPWAAEFEITPARLDMMIAISRDPAGIAQNVLRRVLDVTAPVVTRMLQSLEESGFVVRREHPRDRRTRWVNLTADGDELLDIARRELFHDGLVERELRTLFSPRPDRRALTDREMTRMRVSLTRIRACLFDGSTLVYPAYLASGERSPDCSFAPTFFVHPNDMPALMPAPGAFASGGQLPPNPSGAGGPA